MFSAKWRALLTAHGRSFAGRHFRRVNRRVYLSVKGHHLRTTATPSGPDRKPEPPGISIDARKSGIRPNGAGMFPSGYALFRGLMLPKAHTAPAAYPLWRVRYVAYLLL